MRQIDDLGRLDLQMGLATEQSAQPNQRCRSCHTSLGRVGVYKTKRVSQSTPLHKCLEKAVFTYTFQPVKNAISVQSSGTLSLEANGARVNW